MSNKDFSEELKEYFAQYKKDYENYSLQTILKAKQNLIAIGLIDNDLKIIPPYNGEVINQDDFTRGPRKIKYVKRR